MAQIRCHDCGEVFEAQNPRECPECWAGPEFLEVVSP